MTTYESGAPSCPKCGGNMWDNRLTKKNPKQPDFKCKNQPCEGVIWPPRNGATPARAAAVAAPSAPASYGGPLPWEQQETGAPPQPYAPTPAPNGDGFVALATLYNRCMETALAATKANGIAALGGDVAGAVVASTATLFIQASQKGIRA